MQAPRNEAFSQLPLSLKFSLRWAWLVICAYTVWSAIFHWSPNIVPMAALIASVVAVISIVIVWKYRRLLNGMFQCIARYVDRTSMRRWVWSCILLGVVIRVAVALLHQAEFVSDPAYYWELAQRLANGESYQTGTDRSFWPPGLPLLLMPLIWFFGDEQWVAVLFNILLFVGMSLIALALSLRFIGASSARIAVLLLAIWPNLVFLSAAPHKELLIAFLIPAAILFYVNASMPYSKASRLNRSWLWLALCGICLGFSALTQPATVLFGLVFIAHEATLDAPFKYRLSRLIIAGLCSIMTVLPWTVRNYLVLGEFIPINTAGGVVLLSANNENATGGWIPEQLYMDANMKNADEIGRSRIGTQRATQWIKENKLEFAQLAILKHSRLLCCDDFGAYMLFEHPKLEFPASPTLQIVGKVVSNIFWMLLVFLLTYWALSTEGFANTDSRLAYLFLFSICYFILIFSVFQSADKHHVAVASLIAILASAAMVQDPKNVDARL